jgi:dTMP kinase
MFITFEGIDFSGKSTQVELLWQYLLKQGKKVEIIREPGGTEISEIVRTILLDKNHNKMLMETEIFLFSASRAQLVREKIRPYLNDGIYVILDRFHDSTTAYQGFGRGIPLDSVNHINKLAIGETIPDITFFLDIPVKEADNRKKMQNPDELDRIEVSGSEFYEKVRNGYLHLAKNESRFRILDGTLKKEDVHKKIIDELVRFEDKEIAC